MRSSGGLRTFDDLCHDFSIGDFACVDVACGVVLVMKQWFLDVFKIGLGTSLGFVLLIVLAFILEDWFWPAFRALSGFLFGESL